MLNNTLFDDNLPTILNIQSLDGFAIKHTSLQVEIAAGAVRLDGLYDGVAGSEYAVVGDDAEAVFTGRCVSNGKGLENGV